MSKPLLLTLDNVLADCRENMSRTLRSGQAIKPGSAWIYLTRDPEVRPKALVLRTPKLEDLLEAARHDGVYSLGIAAMSWTPLLTQLHKVIWLWVELRNMGGEVFAAPVLKGELGKWQHLMGLPPRVARADVFAQA